MNILIKLFKYWFSKDEEVVETKVVVVEVLSSSALSRLKAKLEPPILSNSDSPDQAAYRLGIQRALSIVERDFAS